ncbi:MAG: flagellar export chaperone FlgN [Bacillota bacterium]
MNSTEIDRIKGLQQNKIQLLKEILDCSKIQAGLTSEEQTTEFFQLVETRQKYIDSLEKIEETLRQWLAELKGSDINQVSEKEIKALNDKATELIQEISVLDKRNILEIRKGRQRIEGKLRAIRQGRKGIVGYEALSKISTSGAYTDSRN